MAKNSRKVSHKKGLSIAKPTLKPVSLKPCRFVSGIRPGLVVSTALYRLHRPMEVGRCSVLMGTVSSIAGEPSRAVFTSINQATLLRSRYDIIISTKIGGAVLSLVS
jgi:hypothetical protein